MVALRGAGTGDPRIPSDEGAEARTAADGKRGCTDVVGFAPDRVGQTHTDEPDEDAGGSYRKSIPMLGENLIVSGDHPVMDTGIDGSASIENCMPPTADSTVPIHDIGQGVMTI